MVEKLRLPGEDSSGNVRRDIKVKVTAEAQHAHVSAKDNEPELWGNGNESSVAASGTLVTESLLQYGYPYNSVTFTEAGGSNSVSILTAFSQGFCLFQLTGTTPDVDLTATNSNGDVIDDVFVIAAGSVNPVTGQTLGAGTYFIAKP